MLSKDTYAPLEEWAAFGAAVLIPWDLWLVTFRELYAMQLPLFVPDAAWLLDTAFVFYDRMQNSTLDARLPGADVMDTTVPSPLRLDRPAREFWVARTDYAWPGVRHFASVPSLLYLAVRADRSKMKEEMGAHHEAMTIASKKFWAGALSLALH